MTESIPLYQDNKDKETRKMSKEYQSKEDVEGAIELFDTLLSVLEGGDVALDFEELPSVATTIRIVADIIGNASANLRATEELMATLRGVMNDE
jgi:hypothetical protein